MEDNGFEAKTSAFLSWLAGIGVQMSPKMELCDLRKEGRGRGVVAVADFQEDEVIFSIPRTSVLNASNVLQAVQPESLREAIEVMPDWLALTTLMISESLDDNSRWAPYFAVLPNQLHSLVFWTEAELAELQASSVTNKIGKAKAEELFAKHIAPLGLRNCDLGLCHKVASIIMAYAFDIPEKTQEDPNGNVPGEEDGDDLASDDEDDEKTTLSMIPLADMLNADAQRNNARLCSDNEDLEMRTIKPILKGEEVFNDYGQFPQSDLLRRYGYVTEQYALYDVAEISMTSILHAFGPNGNLPLLENNHYLMPLPKEDLDNRIHLAEREGVCEEASYDLSHGGPDNPSIPDELLALLYLLLLNEETFIAISDSKSHMPTRSKMTTELVGQVLAVLIEMREKEYSTTVEEDEEMLRKGGLPVRKVMAVQ